MKKRTVSRCVCHRRSFEDLKKYSQDNNIESVDELIKNRLCGCGCGMCIPYVDLMLETGEVEFNPAAAYQKLTG